MGVDTTLPGDLATLDTIGMGEGLPIWDRMSTIIRARRLDARILMGGFDRMKKGFFDLATMRRALLCITPTDEQMKLLRTRGAWLLPE